jgi:hypothetical protein
MRSFILLERAGGGTVAEGCDRISYDGIAYSHQDAKINCPRLA